VVARVAPRPAGRAHAAGTPQAGPLALIPLAPVGAVGARGPGREGVRVGAGAAVARVDVRIDDVAAPGQGDEEYNNGERERRMGERGTEA